MTQQQLNKCLQKFYLSARRRDGTFCNKKSLTAIRAACMQVCIARRAKFLRYIVRNEVILWSAIFSTCVVYTKTIIHLSVSEKWWILSSPLHGSVNNHYYSPSSSRREKNGFPFRFDFQKGNSFNERGHCTEKHKMATKFGVTVINGKLFNPSSLIF